MIDSSFLDEVYTYLQLVGIDAEAEHDPSTWSIELDDSEDRILVAHEFNHAGWEAVLEDPGVGQRPLIDGPDEYGTPLQVAAWIARLKRDPNGNLA